MKWIYICALSISCLLYAIAPNPDPLESTCGVANLSARCNPCERGFDVFAELIVWTAKEAGADCWAETITINGSNLSNDIREVHFKWSPGFRVGLDYGMMHDEWDTRGFYTWFHTQGKDSVSSYPGAIHSTFLGNFYVDNLSGAGLSGPAYQKASIDWMVRFDIFDWELGRCFWVGGSLALRPFVSVKGGWIHQSIHSEWQNPNLPFPEYFFLGKEDVKNNFWGIGPGFGLGTQWNLFQRGGSFYLFGDFSAALLWGHWSFGDVFENDLPQTITIKLSPIKGGASTLRTFMGFGWDLDCCERSYQISAKLGYEVQFWLDQLQFYSFTGGRLVNELTLQGGTFALSLDF